MRSTASVVKELEKQLIESPIGLTIAGYDPSSGAGVTADLQVFADLQVTGVSAITALTVQSTAGVLGLEPTSAIFLRKTLNCLSNDFPIAGVKIGMLATAQLVDAVADFLGSKGPLRDRVVLDPVLRSSSGTALLEPEGVRRLLDALLPLVGWVTPNLDEAAALLGEGVAGRPEIPDQARKLAALGGPGLHVVITGGHLDSPDDYLRTATGEEQWFPGTRVEPRSVHGAHGTGCVFSSALLCRLLLGDAPVKAVQAAKACVVKRLQGR